MSKTQTELKSYEKFAISMWNQSFLKILMWDEADTSGRYIWEVIRDMKEKALSIKNLPLGIAWSLIHH